ncbi:MAG: glycosyltransferase family 39 protein [Cyanobacteria bacterium J06638_20]
MNARDRHPMPLPSEKRTAIPSLWLWLGGSLLVLGIFFRVYNLDYKVFWIDEANTALRSLGYVSQDVTDILLTGEPFQAEDLQAFQQPSPDRGWNDTMTALRGSAEHTPLYFLLSRLWVQTVGSSIATWRMPAVFFSLLLLPAVFWWGWELFGSKLSAGLATVLVALSPLHVLYAQEARPYSLLALMTALSSATLLWTLRSPTWNRWLLYGLTIVVGLYSQLLFSLVAIAHALYLFAIELTTHKRPTSNLRRYLIVSLGCIVAFSPWLVLLANSLAEVQRKTASLGDDRYSIGGLIDRWFRVLNQMLIDRELAGWNFLLLLLAIAALVYLWRQAPRHATWMLLLVGGVPFLALALPDLVLGGERSLRVRYLFPTVLALQLTLGYWFSAAIPAKRIPQRIVQAILILFISLQILSNTVNAQRSVWWNKSRPASTYFEPVSALVNTLPNPLILTESKVSDLLSFSYWLRPEITLQAIPDATSLEIPQGYDPIYLHNSTPETEEFFRQQGIRLTPIYPANDSVDPWLWQLELPSA